MTRMRHGSTSGQATVEAALFIPLLFLLFLLLTQPMILLYNRMVMEGAAAEACRLGATGTVQGAYSQAQYEAYVKRRLAAIPPVDFFHASNVGNGWEISLQGNAASSEITVEITHRVRVLPLVGWTAQLMNYSVIDGYVVQVSRATMPTQPAWAAGGAAGTPSDWVHNYD